MHRPSLRRLRLPRFAGRLARDRKGSAAVEFAIVSLPFFAMMFMVLELSLIHI